MLNQHNCNETYTDVMRLRDEHEHVAQFPNKTNDFYDRDKRNKSRSAVN